MQLMDQIGRIISASDQVGYVLGFDGMVLHWSERACDLYGFTKTEMVGHSIHQIIPDSHRSSFREFVEMFKLQSCITISTVRCTKLGERLSVDLSATAIETTDQPAILVFARLAAPASPEERQMAVQSAIVQHSSDAIMSVSAEGIIQSWNPAAQRLLGYAPDEILGRPTSTLFPKDRRWARSMGATELAKGHRLMHETIRRHKSGEDIEVTLVASPLFSEVNTYLGYTVTLRGSDHKSIGQAARRDAEQFNQRILSATKDWISAIDPIGRLMFTNEAGIHEIEGGAEKFRIDENPDWQLLWPEDERSRIQQQLGLALDGKFVEFTATRAGAKQKSHWHVSLSPIMSEDKRTLRVVAVARDVSAEHRHRAFNDTVTKELCHRVKNVLAVIAGMARSTVSPDGTVEHYQDALLARIYSLSKSHDLLVRADWRGLELGELAKAQLSNLANLSNVVIDGPPIELKTQPGQMLGIAFHELATNAIKYGALRPEGGQVRLTWKLEDDDQGTRGLHLSWQEDVNTLISCNSQGGFGREILEFAVADMLCGSATFELKPTGARWDLSVPDVGLISRT